ncbi:aldose 1-epimerase [Peribacillus saganii]|uniref:Aldose 1-epimerase n=1 Tax=Peribacillus saganii TaxID=2303992 RepID=A0A372LLA5_9BACI|nr:aldose 1-epimerase [Peribacillus saganii]RFU67625.1 aldose 1-epimerase [Peribacillus saganii]
MSIRNSQFLEEASLEMENEFLKVILLPGQGSNLISIYDKVSNTELLRVPKTMEDYKSASVLYGTPVLFPPNRIDGAVFEFENRTYEFEMNRPEENVHIHGLVHDKKWDVVKVDTENNIIVTQFVSKKYPDVIKQLPHDFTIEMIVQLSCNYITQTLKILNNSNKTMPVGIGLHTTFHFPAEESRLFLNAEQYWELNERKMPTGRLLEIPYKQELIKGMKLYGLALDDIYPIKDKQPAIIEHPAKGINISYKADKGYNHWVVFTMSGKEDLLAMEPYSWVTNAPNMDLPGEITGLIALKQGEETAFTTVLTIGHTLQGRKEYV